MLVETHRLFFEAVHERFFFFMGTGMYVWVIWRVYATTTVWIPWACFSFKTN